MIPKFDGRKRYASLIPPHDHLREIFGFEERTGNLWFLERPKDHFENKKDWEEWNDEWAFVCLGADPISMNPDYPMWIPFYYKWEKNSRGIRNCVAAELILEWVGVPYGHEKGIFFKNLEYKDGNCLNTHLLNIQIPDPYGGDFKLGFTRAFRDEDGKGTTYFGAFPNEGNYAAITYSFRDEDAGYDDSHPAPKIPKLNCLRKEDMD